MSCSRNVPIKAKASVNGIKSKRTIASFPDVFNKASAALRRRVTSLWRAGSSPMGAGPELESGCYGRFVVLSRVVLSFISAGQSYQ